MNIRLIISMLIFLVSCSTPRISYNEIEKQEKLIIDVREKEEVEHGMVEGAIWMPLSEIEMGPVNVSRELAEMGREKNIYIYCRSGKRAQKFINLIQDKNMNVVNLGGYDSLIERGFPASVNQK